MGRREVGMEWDLPRTRSINPIERDTPTATHGFVAISQASRENVPHGAKSTTGAIRRTIRLVKETVTRGRTIRKGASTRITAAEFFTSPAASTSSES